MDPIVQFPASTQSLNPYSYLMNNPMAGRDPSGYCMSETGTHIKECVTVQENYNDGSTKNLGSFNLRSSGDMARASGIALNTNGADAQTSKGPASAPTNGDANRIASRSGSVGGEASNDSGLSTQQMDVIAVTPGFDANFDAWRRDDAIAFVSTPIAAWVGLLTATNPWQRNAPGDDSISEATVPGIGAAMKSAAVGIGVLKNLGRVEEAYGTLDRIPEEALRFLSSGRETQVYLGYREGDAVYCGISCDVARRNVEHGIRFDAQPISLMMPRGQARAVEQAMILRNPQFENMRYSISPQHAYYNDVVRWGESWLQSNGFPR